MNQQEGQDMVGRWISGNVGVLVTLAVIVIGAAAGYTRMESQVTNLEAARVERVRVVDTHLARIDAALARVAQTEYRMTSAEEAIRQTNQSLNSTVSTISERLAEIHKQLGALSTSVAVLAARGEEPERRTELRAAEER